MSDTIFQLLINWQLIDDLLISNGYNKWHQKTIMIIDNIFICFLINKKRYFSKLIKLIKHFFCRQRYYTSSYVTIVFIFHPHLHHHCLINLFHHRFMRLIISSRLLNPSCFHANRNHSRTIVTCQSNS